MSSGIVAISDLCCLHHDDHIRSDVMSFLIHGGSKVWTALAQGRVAVVKTKLQGGAEASILRLQNTQPKNVHLFFSLLGDENMRGCELHEGRITWLTIYRLIVKTYCISSLLQKKLIVFHPL